MSKFKNRSRNIAREFYWQEHDRDTYECPDCGRTQEELLNGFEVHHKNGEPMDNRPENQVGLCRLCHMLREDKKPSKDEIEHLRDQMADSRDQPDTISKESLEYLWQLHDRLGEWSITELYKLNSDENVRPKLDDQGYVPESTVLKLYEEKETSFAFRLGKYTGMRRGVDNLATGLKKVESDRIPPLCDWYEDIENTEEWWKLAWED